MKSKSHKRKTRQTVKSEELAPSNERRYCSAGCNSPDAHQSKSHLKDVQICKDCLKDLTDNDIKNYSGWCKKCYKTSKSHFSYAEILSGAREASVAAEDDSSSKVVSSESVSVATHKRVKCVYCNNDIHISHFGGVIKEGFICDD